MAATPSPADLGRQLEVFRGLCGGAVHLPGDAGYDEARSPWNLQADARPAAVAYPAFPEEVSTVVRAAAEAELKVAVMGTGHGAPPLAGRLGDAVLLRTSAMTQLHVDADRRTARAAAGVLWGDVVDRAGERGLAARHMSSPSVGVVGSSLGGGISWYGRRHGLQCSALTAVEVVLADGSVTRAAGDNDLLWAARGGGWGVRRRDRRRVRPASGCNRVRRHARVGLGACRTGAPRVGRLGTHRAGGRHDRGEAVPGTCRP